MSVKLGKDAKLYFCAAGIGGTPSWTELSNVKNVSTSLQKGEADVTTRANAGWKASVGTLKEGSIEFEMIWDPDDTGFTALENAYFNDTVIGIAVMTGGMGEAGAKGLWADCAVLDFSRDESLEEAITVKVTVKPTYSANAPQWKTIGSDVVQSLFSLALVVGAGSVDLTNLAGDIDGTSKAVTVLRVTNNGANALTISKGATNGYGLLAGESDVVVDAGATVTLVLTASDTVASDCKVLDLAGTAVQSSDWEITLETP